MELPPQEAAPSVTGNLTYPSGINRASPASTTTVRVVAGRLLQSKLEWLNPDPHTEWAARRLAVPGSYSRTILRPASTARMLWLVS